MVWNKYQSTPEELNIESYPEEVQQDFWDFINSVPYIKNLISADRPLCKDLPKDEQGRAIIDISNPPIIEDVDYFRQSAIFYQKHKKYTNLRPNPNPNSEYGKWMEQEVKRCWNGMIRPEDGAWITGDMYFYLNYSPIIQSKIRPGTKVADRIVDFPEWWEGILYRSIYQYIARNNAHHAAEIAKRGASKSFFSASQLTKNFILGENEINQQEVRSLVLAYQKEYLTKDGTLNKFVDMRDFLAKNTQWPHKTLTRSLDKMQWRMGRIDLNTGAEIGTKNEVLGLSSKDDPDKARGKRSSKIIVEEFGNFPKITDTYRILLPSVQEGDIVFGQISMIGCVCAGTKVFTKEGKLINIEDIKQEDGILGYDIQNKCISKENITYIQEPVYKECVRITTKNRTLECSKDHPILTRTTHSKRTESYKISNKRKFWYDYNFVEAGKLTGKNNQAIIIADDVVHNFGNEHLADPYLIGLLIGDGSYGIDKTPRLSNCDLDVINYVETKYNTVTERTHLTKDNKLYKEIRIKGICKMLRDCGIYGQIKSLKRLPTNYLSLSEEDSALMLAGLFDTDGTVSKKNNHISITSLSKDLLKQIGEVLNKFGIASSIYKIKATIKEGRKDKNDWYNLTILGRNNIIKFSKYIPIKIKYKIDNLNTLLLKFKDSYNYSDNTSLEKIIKIEDIGIKRVYNLTANNTHTYIANGIITHNTGGSEGNDFAGAQEIIFNPIGYNIQPVPNVYDKSLQGKGECIFFFPAYLNRKGCYNSDGISDVTKALLELCYNRYIVKYNSTDPMALTRTKAENPITLQEAIMRRDSTIFPVAAIMERLEQIKSNPSIMDDVLVGTLVQKEDGTVICKPSADVPIRNFPHKDNKLEGAVEIYKLPILGHNGKPMVGRYWGGIDPYDDDASQTMSLGSIFIMDSFTDEIVAEYTGRPEFADDFYEICRKLCIMYNAKVNYENNKKGLFTYFSKMHCLYYLTDTLEFLKDKDEPIGSITTNKTKGTNASLPVNNHARRNIRDWLLKPVTTIEVIDGEEQEITKPLLFTIKNIALLQELSLWNPDGNYDRVSALGMLMLLREDMLRLYGPEGVNTESQNDEDDLANDEFFTRNFGGNKEDDY